MEADQLAAILNAASIALSASELGQLADVLDRDGSGNLQVPAALLSGPRGGHGAVPEPAPSQIL